MRREEKCQALLLKATGYQPRMDRVLTEPESAKGAKDKKNWISMGPTRKGAKSSDTKHEVTQAFVASSYTYMHILKRAPQCTGPAAVPDESIQGICTLDYRVCGALKDWGYSHPSKDIGTSACHHQVL